MADTTGDAWLKLRVRDRGEVAQDVLQLDLEPVGGGPLPTWDPGAHIEIRLPSGLTRQYSLCGPPESTGSYSICVLRESAGRGGSAEVHRDLQPGMDVDARPPRNHFPLADADAYLLIAGGIGITPLKSMAESLERRGASWRLVYGGRSIGSMAFVEELKNLGGDRVQIVPQDADGLIDVTALIGSVGQDTHVYCCGPSGLLDTVTEACRDHGIADRVHFERFSAPETTSSQADASTFDVELRVSEVTLRVPAEQSILEVVQAVRSDINFSCQEGYCGSCETRVLEGQPDHRGTLMSPEEHDEEGTMLICVGRSRTPRLVLDL
ncbi:PDR/VanB family oxidoreductase [Streptomyces odonnellii]|uniref:PDR/VanB family oxidoreductase n=1 Tax=Streptomyces odonnellii TaxID=1417980 RepID=UPI000625A44B|nr:PDR/VanB family oxidoreductase [Streptomyces odonnellii]